jgi:acyl-ACP thioesterase
MEWDQLSEKSENSVVHELDVEFSFLNEKNIMKPSAYQNLFAQLAERHLSVFKADANETMKYGLSWALISISIQIVRPIDHCIRLYASTWYSQKRGPYYRRELIFRNENGDLMFKGSTFSILMEVESRNVFRKKQTPFKMTQPYEVFCVEAGPRYRVHPDIIFQSMDTRKVYNSYIDNLGHVNNQCYGDFALDALSDEEIILLKDLKRIDFYFISELRKKDVFTIEKATAHNQIMIQGQNNTKGELAFAVIFQF